MRGAVGADFPVFVKMSAYDGFPGGVGPAEAARVAAELNARGIDAIEVSAGTPEGARRGGWDHIMPAPFVEGRFFDYALQIKAAVTCPVICVEGWRDPRRIAQALESIDAVSLCRPFIREPHLAARWRSGDLTPASCISCNRCLELIVDVAWAASFTRSHGRGWTRLRDSRISAPTRALASTVACCDPRRCAAT